MGQSSTHKLHSCFYWLSSARFTFRLQCISKVQTGCACSAKCQLRQLKLRHSRLATLSVCSLLKRLSYKSIFLHFCIVLMSGCDTGSLCLKLRCTAMFNRKAIFVHLSTSLMVFAMHVSLICFFRKRYFQLNVQMAVALGWQFCPMQMFPCFSTAPDNQILPLIPSFFTLHSTSNSLASAMHLADLECLATEL